jgi:hypothetical protein
MTHLMDVHRTTHRRSERCKKLSVERLLVWLRRHLQRDYRHPLHPGPVIEGVRMLAAKLAQYFRLAHAGGRVQQ